MSFLRKLCSLCRMVLEGDRVKNEKCEVMGSDELREMSQEISLSLWPG